MLDEQLLDFYGQAANVDKGARKPFPRQNPEPFPRLWSSPSKPSLSLVGRFAGKSNVSVSRA